jgi:Asp-tRNA(Asn)/Glu-tRNA(Gln) amidotransferase A subunit family amidase
MTIDHEGALETARAADKARAGGHFGPLLGVPIGVKDNYLTRGLTTTFGTAVLNDFKPTRDADVVAAVKGAGAIVLGKNNLVEMSYGLTGLNDHHGQVRNPFKRAHCDRHETARTCLCAQAILGRHRSCRRQTIFGSSDF